MAKIKSVLTEEEKAQLKYREHIDLEQWANDQVKETKEWFDNLDNWKKNTNFGRCIQVEEGDDNGNQSIQSDQSPHYIDEEPE